MSTVQVNVVEDEEDEEEFFHFSGNQHQKDNSLEDPLSEMNRARHTISSRYTKSFQFSLDSESWGAVKGLTKRIFSKRTLDKVLQDLSLNESDLTICKRGWLYKQGVTRKNWKRRWFVLTDDWLRYFPSENEKHALGTMHLDCELLYPATGMTKENLTLSLLFPERNFFIRAESDEELSSWLVVLRDSISRTASKSFGSSNDLTSSPIVTPNTSPAPPPPPPAPVFSDIWQEEDDTLTHEFQTSDLDGLIKRLTLSTKNSASFVKEFLLTYRIFLEPLQLLMLLQDRFWTEVDESLDEQERTQYIETKQFPIRLRVNNVIRTWFDMSPKDFDNELISECLNFFTQQEKEYQAESLMRTILPVKKAMSRKVMGLSAFEEPADFITQANDLDTPSVSIFSFDDNEIATHLLYIEHSLFRRIAPNEFLKGSWTGHDKYLKAKGIVDMIEHFNKVSTWVSMLVLNESSLESRKLTVGRLIEIAEACYQVQNFNAVKEIVSGLITPAVSRLKTTWQGISNSKTVKLKQLQKLVSDDKGYECLRAKLGESQPPIMPFLGMYLQDFNAADEGSPDSINGQINFEKCRKIARITMGIITLQKAVPTLESPNMPLLKLLGKIPQGSKDLTMALALSKKLEP